MKRALVLVADGTEEMEATITVDLLRRGGVEVIMAGLDGPGVVTCARGVKLVPDLALADVRGDFDVVVLPGGMGGAKAFAASEAVGGLLAAQVEAGRAVGAICAAPMALARHGLFEGRPMTAHPAVHEVVARHGQLRHEPVVQDGLLITSQGPGTAFQFGLALLAHLIGPEVAEKVRAPLMMPT
ncbi:MAG: DJ-1/PfpI family protein [Deltaproteobacteria bacterium]|nr:DJ-1/PfpI family protein [Deltaproteobacteria bacterium]